jgi:Flp pilus assembly protein TadG
MNLIRKLRDDQAGSAVIEMAVGLPILVLFIWGIFQVGIALQAIAGMQHGLGEGARFGTICLTPNPVTGCATPTDAEIRARIQSKVFGVGVGTFNEPSITTPATTDCTDCRDASVTFSMPLNFLFFNGPTINITRSKRIHLA